MLKVIFCSQMSSAISTMNALISCLQYCFLSRQEEQERRSVHCGCLQKYSMVLDGCLGQLTLWSNFCARSTQTGSGSIISYNLPRIYMFHFCIFPKRGKTGYSVAYVEQFIEMIQKKNKSHSKQNRPPHNQLNATVFLPNNKSLGFSVPQPCPVSTLKECLAQSLANYTHKIAYLQTANADWLTDYKIQVGQGWLRADLTLQCIFKADQYQKMTSVQAYEMLKCIGVGGFSKVYLCRDKRDGEFYAAKFIQKQKLQGKSQLILNQRAVNEQVAFPFLVQMKEFFETEEYYIMILDYCPGGELFHLQKKVVRFSEQQAKKYFIEVLLAIEYLHNKSIVYRDLKPENIMIDLKGHIRIADFGLAKVSKEKRYSYCGSLEYMSPEIVGRIGHSFEVDYYCLGALLYEMVVGCPPFYCYNSSEIQTKSRIMYEQVDFPQEIGLSDSIKDLMRQLLGKDPSKRLGHLGGVKEIKCHPWIGWINKSDYLEKKLKMPYPVNLDCFNFDASDITQSANRMLYNLQYEKLFRNGRNTSQPKSKSKSKDKRSLSKNKLSTRILNKRSEQRHREFKSTNSSLNKQKCLSGLNHSKQREQQEKTMLKNGSFCIKTKKKHHNSQNILKINRFQSIRNCYLGTSSNNLNKFLRFPTQSYDSHSELIKERRSYVKVDTENKQAKNRDKDALKKRKAKEEYAFQKVKRKI